MHLGDAGVIRVVEEKCEGSMATSPCGGLDGSDHLGHLLHHFVHDSCGRGCPMAVQLNMRLLS